MSWVASRTSARQLALAAWKGGSLPSNVQISEMVGLVEAAFWDDLIISGEESTP
jgi:hypothetical protein